ncbi:protein-disulfide reductase DsbD [Piscinibacter sp.]|jgi:thiol:disulfide interchange protein DsbD|uniref:protein-disulfide reductase DsbD n=1 Tax=Piscinibacter sp. TaxID=1903157 RepID=UPI002F4103F2
MKIASRPSLDPLRCLRAALALIAAAWFGVSAAASSTDEFLDPEVAFKAAARVLDARNVEVSFDIAPGYYLYREQFKFTADGGTLGAPQIPPGTVKFDETFGKNVETHRDLLRIALPVQQAGLNFRLAVRYQGCADKGLCYPPAQLRADVSLAAFGGNGSVRVLPGREMPVTDSQVAGLRGSAGINTASSTDSAGIAAVLQAGRFWNVVGVFFLAGMLLSLTPCMLPMLPILSSIIVGHGERVSRRRGVALAASYSLGMALVYTGFGIAAGLAGEGLAATLQNPWVLVAFALGLVALALAMFGVYELRLPAALTEPLTRASQRLPAGRFTGVFAMGGLSALIVSPCVAAPLAGALVYLSQTRDVALGGAALFALACGMSVPLLLLGASAGALLPRAGGWMDDVKRFFGLLLLAVAIWIVQPVLPASLALGLWGALLIAGAVVLLAFHPIGQHGAPARRLLRRTAGAVLGVLGLLQLVGAASGGTDPLQPLAHLRAGRSGEPVQTLAFTPVRTTAELDAALGSGRPVMLDFYADWCVSCKEMERFTFSDPEVRAKLSGALLLKADVTRNTADDRALLRRFGLFGPPGTIFFDAQGRELASLRVIGYQSSDRFLETLRSAGL